ncbi:MAG: hypothetical protein KJ620_08570 [Candidatus Edwardsbacteria bacterium]|nr:hypothetical protein [Candidatus Edwardsbacteria bacterium]MBU1576773.1 hypothetical protein [Candidatus Edwardsbacteria bacterium]MBU2464588.1 hypothetical protein [Candidatus Edwardsbacteria bacterium]MBU2593370.1 hypothetical protein [Candidatus Edwardsbacteria bacterium]
MNGAGDNLKQIPEYREFEDMLKQCPAVLKDKGEEYAARLKLYTAQFASGEMIPDEYRKTVENLQFEMKQWVNTQSIFKRRKMDKLITGIGVFVLNKLIDAIINKLLPK